MVPASLRLIALLAFVWAWIGQSGAALGAESERVRVVYWEKWTGFEKDAMQAVVEM